MKTIYIYIIKCCDETVKDYYIGSTTNFKTRVNNHKVSVKNPNYKQQQSIHYHIRDNGGLDNWIFEILLKKTIGDEKNIFRIEQNFIERYKPKFNKTNAYGYIHWTHEQLKEYKKLKAREYRKNDEYRERQNKFSRDRNLIKYDCDCGKKNLSLQHKSRHEKSVFHIKNK